MDNKRIIHINIIISMQRSVWWKVFTRQPKSYKKKKIHLQRYSLFAFLLLFFLWSHMKRCCSLIGWSLCSGRLEHAPQRLVTYFDVCVCVTVTVCDCVSIYCVCVCVCCGTPASTVTCFWPGDLIPPIIIQLLDMTESHWLWPQHIPHSQGQRGQHAVWAGMDSCVGGD